MRNPHFIRFNDSKWCIDRWNIIKVLRKRRVRLLYFLSKNKKRYTYISQNKRLKVVFLPKPDYRRANCRPSTLYIVYRSEPAVLFRNTQNIIINYRRINPNKKKEDKDKKDDDDEEKKDDPPEKPDEAAQRAELIRLKRNEQEIAYQKLIQLRRIGKREHEAALKRAQLAPLRERPPETQQRAPMPTTTPSTSDISTPLAVRQTFTNIIESQLSVREKVKLLLKDVVKPYLPPETIPNFFPLMVFGLYKWQPNPRSFTVENIVEGDNWQELTDNRIINPKCKQIFEHINDNPALQSSFFFFRKMIYDFYIWYGFLHAGVTYASNDQVLAEITQSYQNLFNGWQNTIPKKLVMECLGILSQILFRKPFHLFGSELFITKYNLKLENKLVPNNSIKEIIDNMTVEDVSYLVIPDKIIAKENETMRCKYEDYQTGFTDEGINNVPLPQIGRRQTW
jgi:hypothetical protein